MSVMLILVFELLIVIGLLSVIVYKIYVKKEKYKVSVKKKEDNGPVIKSVIQSMEPIVQTQQHSVYRPTNSTWPVSQRVRDNRSYHNEDYAMVY